MQYKIIIRPGETSGYIVECPALPGCVSQGKTKQEAIRNIRDAMKGCLAVLNERTERTYRAHRNYSLYRVAV